VVCPVFLSPLTKGFSTSKAREDLIVIILETWTLFCFLFNSFNPSNSGATDIEMFLYMDVDQV
jgi:hypothetical protein